MKRIALLVFSVIGIQMLASASLTFDIVNVEAHTRYPWNGKIDVDFQLTSSDPATNFVVSIECHDRLGNSNIVMRTVRYNDRGSAETSFCLNAGTHRLTWDADADIPNMKIPNVSFMVSAIPIDGMTTGPYLVIDLSTGASATQYPITYLSSVPEDGWTSEYKTTKLVLRKCSEGSDSLGRYTLTKAFYAGIFEVTQKQWELVMGAWPDKSPSQQYGLGDANPAYFVSYEDIRGSVAGKGWPGSSNVDAASFVGKLREKTGLTLLDLPTEAQWEYAARAGSATRYCTGDDADSLTTVAWYEANAQTSHSVGEKLSNAWGIFDMHGNAWEWCLDYCGASLQGADPVGANSNAYRYCRGGSFSSTAEYVASSHRELHCNRCSNERYYDVGFRLFLTCP